MRLIVDPVDVDEEGGKVALRAVHLVERVAIVAVGPEPLPPLDHLLEEREGEPGVGAQPRGREARPHLLERGDIRLIVGQRRRVAEVVPGAVILVADAAIGFGHRVSFELCLVIGLEELGELGVLSRGGGGRLRRGARSDGRFGRRRAGGEQRGRGKQQEAGHHGSGVFGGCRTLATAMHESHEPGFAASCASSGSTKLACLLAKSTVTRVNMRSASIPSSSAGFLSFNLRNG